MEKVKEKTVISWSASADEIRQVIRLKRRLHRRSNADLMRFLVQQEADRIDGVPAVRQIRMAEVVSCQNC